MTDNRPPLLVVLGETGAGKSAAAHRVAVELGGEIISADAFAVYRGFDIGTAKPTAEERRQVPYHLIDVADPAETFSAGRWAREARSVIEDIAARGRLPIVCGGSGFYIEALLRGLPPGEARLDLGPMQIVKVPHHGSRSSSSPAFVRRVAPRIALVSAGFRNRRS